MTHHRLTPIYLDGNATSRLHPLAQQAMQEVLMLPQNASSVHYAGRAARSLCEQAKHHLMEAIGIQSPQGWDCVWTGTGTNANNLLIQGTADLSHIVSAIEHPSLLSPSLRLPSTRVIPVTPEGVVDVEALPALLADLRAPFILSVMAANNETGIIQPLAEIATITHAHGGWLHSDATQMLGKMPLDVEAIGLDAVTLSSHKSGGPHGAAALLFRKALSIQPLLHGGGQQRGYWPGTENVPAIYAWGMWLHRGRAMRAQHWKAIEKARDAMEAAFCDSPYDITVVGKDQPRLPNTSCVACPLLPRDAQVIRMDMLGVAISSGSACSSGKMAPSHVLEAMGLPEALRESAIRISADSLSDPSDFAACAQRWMSILASATPVESGSHAPSAVPSATHSFIGAAYV